MIKINVKTNSHYWHQRSYCFTATFDFECNANSSIALLSSGQWASHWERILQEKQMHTKMNNIKGNVKVNVTARFPFKTPPWGIMRFWGGKRVQSYLCAIKKISFHAYAYLTFWNSCFCFLILLWSNGIATISSHSWRSVTEWTFENRFADL